MREHGFYFVKQDLDIGWECAYWSGKIWLIVGNTYHFKDNNFLEIDEKQIKRE